MTENSYQLYASVFSSAIIAAFCLFEWNQKSKIQSSKYRYLVEPMGILSVGCFCYIWASLIL
eukprot:UN24276